MTETMVERVDRVIREKVFEVYDIKLLNSPGELGSAALEAMRSPTDEMLHIGDEAVDTCTKVDPCLTPAKHIWADMITAALGDG